jgi:arylsulfatase A-like enzyme
MTPAVPPERPNLLVLVSDTLRRDHLGAYGNTWARTPNLDRLAAESVVFDAHHVGSFPTMPARADLLTGRLSFTFMSWGPLPGSLPTLPEFLSAAGYLTTAVVDTPFFVRNGFGYDRGFQDFLWIRGQGDSQRPEERADARSTWRHEADRYVARTVSAAEEWLERHHLERFLLYVDTWDPHEPWNAPEYYTRLYLPDYDGREVDPPYACWRDAGLTERDVEVAHAAYCGEVTLVDRWLGWLVDKLEVLGIADRTVVVFLSDHGFYFGEHGYLGKSVWDETVRTQLWSPLYHELTQLPLFVRIPGVEPCRVKALTTAADVMPTLLELAGVEPPSNLDGASLLPVICDDRPGHRPLVVSSWPLEYQKGRISVAVDSTPRRVPHDLPLTVTTHETTLVVGGPDDPPELYDLARDPGESTNLWPERSAEAAELLAAALDVLERAGTSAELLAPRRAVLMKLLAAAGAG